MVLTSYHPSLCRGKKEHETISHGNTKVGVKTHVHKVLLVFKSNLSSIGMSVKAIGNDNDAQSKSDRKGMKPIKRKSPSNRSEMPNLESEFMTVSVHDSEC